MNDENSRLLPTDMLIKMLQELKIREELPSTKGIVFKYLTTHRRLSDKVVIRLADENDENRISQLLESFGNSDIQSLLEKNVLCYTSVWSEAYTERHNELFLLDSNIIKHDILLNETAVNHISNRMGPIMQ